jgi:hypothetical protein
MFENRVLRRIFGTKRKEICGRWRKLYNKEFHKFSYQLRLDWSKLGGRNGRGM